MVSHPEEENDADRDMRRRGGLLLPRMAGGQGKKEKKNWEDLAAKDLKDILRSKYKLDVHKHLNLNLGGGKEELLRKVKLLALPFEGYWPIVAAGDAAGGADVLGEGEQEGGNDQDDGAMDIVPDGPVVGANDADAEIIEYDSEEEIHEELIHPRAIREEEEEEEKDVGDGGARRSGRARHTREVHAPDDWIPCTCGCRQQYPYHGMVLCRRCGSSTGRYVRRVCVSKTYECELCRNIPK